MRWILLIIGLVAIAGITVGGIHYWPRGRYLELVTDSKYSDLYELKISTKGFLQPKQGSGLNINKPTDLDLKDGKLSSSDLWKKFIIKEFLIPVPYRHAQFYITPEAKLADDNKTVNLGVSFYNQNHQKIIGVTFLKSFYFKRKMNSQKIYQVPLFADFLKEKLNSEIWEDIFSRNLSEPPEQIQEMVYQLYLLEHRTKILPRNFKNFYFIQDQRKAIVELPSDNVNYEKYLVYFFDQGIIHQYTIDVYDVDPQYVQIKNHLIKNIQHQEFSPELSRTIYREFKALSYQQQTSGLGMMYLFSAWSLDTENKNFLKIMINYLERGKDNFRQLGPLYEYALARYKTSFSSSDEFLKEDSEEKLRRLAEEERRDIRLKEATRPIDVQDDFSSDQERIDFFLNKAKELGPETDNSELTVD